MERTYVDYLRKELQMNKEGTEFERELSHFPDLVKLLCDLLENDVLDKQSRQAITSSLGYVLVPNDILPEEIYGAYGYMDDLYLACLTVRDLRKKYPDLVEYLWTHENPIDTVLDVCLYVAEKFLEEKNLKDKLLRYAGLSD